LLAYTSSFLMRNVGRTQSLQVAGSSMVASVATAFRRPERKEKTIEANAAPHRVTEKKRRDNKASKAASSSTTGGGGSGNGHGNGGGGGGGSATNGQGQSDIDAATKIQSLFRGHVARVHVARLRIRRRQRLEEEEHDRLRKARLAEQEKAKAAAKAAQKKAAEEAQEAKLRAYRSRRCAVELMLQSLSAAERPWEEHANTLLQLLETSACDYTDWFGETLAHKRAARKLYLRLARRWHPDKWAASGEDCVEVATEVTKALVRAYEEAMKKLPVDAQLFAAAAATEDEEEDREVWEFASWVGVAFEGMHEVWKERRKVTGGNR